MKATTTMLVLLLFLSGCSNDSVFEVHHTEAYF